MKLKAWLDEERGRYTALANHLGISVGRASQIAEDGVPPKFMLSVRDFTGGSVSLEELVEARTPHQPTHGRLLVDAAEPDLAEAKAGR